MPRPGHSDAPSDQATAPQPSGTTQARPQDTLRRAWDSDLAYSFRTSPVALVSGVVALLIILAAVLAPWLAPQNPYSTRDLILMDGFTAPMQPSLLGNVYLLGTDDQGRDVLSAILYGARISLFVGFSAVLFAMVLGITLGLVAGYRGGWVDGLLMRIADVQLTFPSILLALLIFGIARGMIPPAYRETMAIWVLIVAIGLSDWVQYARVVRGATMVEKNKEYVQAARVIGVHPARILTRHILPNVMGPVLVIGTIGLALAIIAEATLSFLGVGVPPTTPSLGTLIRNGQSYLFSGEWWILAFPAAALLALALSVNLLGDWLRDALNPRLR
ncbi:ABC transporter permease [Alkalilacustris brevis]|uniref:ABC transporter permease n=1 Tax=Alkalilacustris brevis TaxID=2026338 RepID=UPI000E0DD203|nr:ABC transporter permease [Alkalilacustris brevis]